MARIEWAFVEAFDAAELAPLTLEQIAALDGQSRLALQPHLQLIALSYPADELVLELHAHEKRQTSEAGVPTDRSSPVGWEAGVPTDRSSSVGWEAGVPTDRSSSVGWEAGVAHEEDSGAAVAIPRLPLRPTWIAAHRLDLSVYYRRIAREEFQTLSALRSGVTLAAAIDAGFLGSRIPERRRAEHVQQWFESWAELGWICVA